MSQMLVQNYLNEIDRLRKFSMLSTPPLSNCYRRTRDDSLLSTLKKLARIRK